MVTTGLLLVFPLCMAIAACTDFLEMKIPNILPVLLILGFFLLAPMLGLPLAAFGWHLLAAGVVFAVCFVGFACQVMGGGDAKLLTAASLWFGFNASLMTFLVYVALFGGALTLVILLLRANSHITMALGIRLPQSLTVQTKIPYGIAIALGGFCSLPVSPLAIPILGVPAGF